MLLNDNNAPLYDQGKCPNYQRISGKMGIWVMMIMITENEEIINRYLLSVCLD